MFYDWKIISSKTSLHQIFSSKILVETFLWLQNHFLQNRFAPNIFIKKILVENVLLLENHLLENSFAPKIFIKKILVENFLLLQNHFLENWFAPKMLIKKFWSNICCCKVISSKSCLHRKFSTKKI
jgi:hypothetical protein